MAESGWDEHAKFVLEKLETTDKTTLEIVNTIHREFRRFDVEIAKIKERMAVWAIIAGVIPTIITLTLTFVKFSDVQKVAEALPIASHILYSAMSYITPIITLFS